MIHCYFFLPLTGKHILHKTMHLIRGVCNCCEVKMVSEFVMQMIQL